MNAQRHATGDAGGDEGNLLARCQLSCSRPLRCLGRLIALVVRVLRTALAEQVRAFAGHGGAAWDGKRRCVCRGCRNVLTFGTVLKQSCPVLWLQRHANGQLHHTPLQHS